MSQSRHLAAIMFADIVGYTALMQKDEQAALEILNRFKELLEDITPKHQGRIVQYFGDGCLLAFDSSTSSVACAISLQKAFSEEPTLPVRIGLHLGDVIFRNENVFGDGVNIASRIESLGIPGSILMSKPIRDQIKNKSDFLLVSLGSFDFKNASEPMEVFALANPGFVVPKREEMHGKLKDIQKKSGILKWLSGIALIAVSIFALWYFIGQKKSSGSTSEKSIAVLPFRNDSPEDSTQYFMDGVMDELLNNLQTIKSLRVIGRTSVEQYRDKNKPISEIAKELGVNYIVEGSGQKSGKSLRMRVQLISAKKETHIWGKSFEQETLELDEYFKIQSGFAEAIASELNAALSRQEKMLIEQMPTNKNEAYEAYLKGKFYLQNISQNNLNISQKHFELAIEKDPGYAYAYTGIAYIWLLRQQAGFTIPEEAGPKAMEAILKAAELDSTIAEVHFMKASINYLRAWDWKTSESEFRKAIAINPNHAEVHGLYAQLLYILGRPREAIKHSELSFKLDPMNQLVKMWYGFNFLYEKRYDEMISICREVLEMDSTNFSFYGGISEAFHLKGKYKEALEATKLYYINFYPDIEHVFDQYTKLGYTGLMNLEADLLVIQSEKKYIIPSDIVYLYVLAGNKEKALQWLEKGYKLRDPLTPYIGRPFFTSLLHNEPRYQELLRKLNIPYYD